MPSWCPFRSASSFVQDLIDSVRNVMGCGLNQDTRVQDMFDDVVSTIHESLS